MRTKLYLKVNQMIKCIHGVIRAIQTLLLYVFLFIFMSCIYKLSSHTPWLNAIT